MSFNGSGIFNVYTPGTPYVTGTIISSTIANNVNSDFATGLSTVITKNGQTTITNNIPFGGNKITGLGAATLPTDAAQYKQIQSGETNALTGVAGTNTITASLATPTLVSYITNQRFIFIPAVSNTAATTLNINSIGAKNIFANGVALLGGELLAGFSYEVVYDGTQFNIVNAFAPNAQPTVSALGADYFVIADASDGFKSKKALVSDIVTLAGIVNNYFTGGTFSTAGASTTMSIASWFGADSTNARIFSLSAIAKTTASWVVGTAAGGKSQTGATANNTWYHFYAIYRPDTGVSDVCFSTNANGLVAGDFVAGGGNVANAYTQFRYLGSGLTNASAQWTKFNQLGDFVYWTTPAISASNATVSTVELQVVTSTPLGIPMIGIFNVLLANTASRNLRLYANADDDITVTIDNATVTTNAAGQSNATVKQIITDTLAQVSWKADASTTGCYLQTLGYIYQRG